MGTHLHQELEKIRLKIIKMFALVEESLSKTSRALLERNVDLAQEVLDADQAINILEVELDSDCLRLMAREQPVARDLRFVIACSRIGKDLERAGDEAVNIAERAIMLSARPPIPFTQPLEELANKSMEMFRESITAFVHGDSALAVAICGKDNLVDELYVKLIKKLIDYLACEKIMVERPVHAIMISKNFERVADLSTNIAEAVVFIEKGLDIRHSIQFDALKMGI